MGTKFWKLPIMILLLAHLPVHAAWQENGNVICDAANNQMQAVVVHDGAGGAIIVWQDNRNGTDYNIFAQRVDRFGAALWPAGGVPVCMAAGNQDAIKIMTDGAGGAFLVWQDMRNSNYDIYAQRINSLGSAQWATDGVAICDTVNGQQGCVLTTDGWGGAIIAWSDLRSGSADVYAQKINSAGVVQWARNGVVVADTINSQQQPDIVSDGVGGAVITWSDSRGGMLDVYAQRANNAGTMLWTKNGVAICTYTGHQQSPVMTTDGASGAIISWQDYRTGIPDIYAQRVNGSGVVQWAANAVAICDTVNSQMYPRIVSDKAGGAIIVWHDERKGSFDQDVFVQRVSGTGSMQWSRNGLAVSSTTGNQQYPSIMADGSGGAFFVWSDLRIGNSDVYTQKVSSAGIFQWAADGIAVSSAFGTQTAQALATDGAAGAIIVWYDYRNGSISGYDIYAQRVDRYDGSYYGRFAPDIFKAPDIPNDQGGFVNLQWTPSYLDVYPDTTISFYSLWRSLSGTGAKSLISKGARLVETSDITEDFVGPAYRLIEKDSKAYAWEWIANIPWRHYLTAYSYPMPTLCDTLTGEMAWHHFFISAQTDNPLVYWDSYPDSGYSVDDLAPAKVLNLGGAAAKALALNWKKNTELDLRDYAVYYNGTFLGFTAETTYTYSGTLNTNDYFAVTAYDVHNNQGPAADPWIYLGPMAVHLSFFTAGQTSQAVELNWRTESEMDCATWVIQRSSSGATAFADIGKIPGQGTSTMPHDYIYRDSEQLENGDYLYRIVEISATGNKTCYQPVSVTYKSNTPKIFSLIGAYPNPARGAVIIKYQLPEESQVRLEVYNVSGQLVKTVFEGFKPAGHHQVGWNDNTLHNGIYFYKLTARLCQGSGGQAGDFSATKKLVLVR